MTLLPNPVARATAVNVSVAIRATLRRGLSWFSLGGSHIVRIFNSILLVATLTVLVGCVSDVEKRRLNTLERLHYSAGGKFKRIPLTISNAVSQATEQSLKSPCIIEAMLLPGNPAKTNGLVVFYWLSATPSADGLCLEANDGRIVEVRILQDYLDQARDDAKDMVAFNATVSQHELATVWSSLIAFGGRVTLTAHGRHISNTIGLGLGSKREQSTNKIE